MRPVVRIERKLRAEPEPLTRDVEVDCDTELAREMKQGVDRRIDITRIQPCNRRLRHTRLPRKSALQEPVFHSVSRDLDRHSPSECGPLMLGPVLRIARVLSHDIVVSN